MTGVRIIKQSVIITNNRVGVITGPIGVDCTTLFIDKTQIDPINPAISKATPMALMSCKGDFDRAPAFSNCRLLNEDVSKEDISNIISRNFRYCVSMENLEDHIFV
jgi:hypothetical protein